MQYRATRIAALVTLLGGGAFFQPPAWGQEPGQDQERAKPGRARALPEMKKPGPVPDVLLGPRLPTVPVRRGAQSFNEKMVDASLLPKDQPTIWVLDFAFLPVRIKEVEISGKGRRKLHYLYYRVVNRTGKDRTFVPQFTLVTDTGKRYEDVPLPEAVRVIQDQEDPAIPLLGAVTVMGVIPPSKKEGIDDAVFGVAIWEGVDPKADRFSVYVRGLSNGYHTVTAPQSNKPVTRHKTLRIDFLRRGDEYDTHSREIELLEPPYEWIYW